jgi:hypothetical protein
MEKEIKEFIEAYKQLDTNSRYYLLSYAILARSLRENTLRQYGIPDREPST